jgi:hypothetical protein
MGELWSGRNAAGYLMVLEVYYSLPKQKVIGYVHRIALGSHFSLRLRVPSMDTKPSYTSSLREMKTESNPTKKILINRPSLSSV